MNIILVRQKSGATVTINLSRFFIVFLGTLFFSSPFIGYYYGLKSFDTLPTISQFDQIEPFRNELNKVVGSIYKDELQQQKKELGILKQNNQENINALTYSMANLQAHIIRLDSLGNRLIEVAQLDKKAFNFDLEPSIGGASDENNQMLATSSPTILSQRVKYDEFVTKMQQLSQDIESKNKQLTILENLLITEQLQHASTPSGKPTKKGWISSYFGSRKDPFTGKKKMHKGVDIAGKSGSSVLATADGVVIMAEKQNGYGKVLEIDHGYGLSTRYGHNRTILVKVGDVVKKGQNIAIMGSTGRSTGPHVHYEVLKNGRPVNPQRYIVTAKK